MTREEMTRACEIAASEVLKRSEKFKPAKSAIRDEQGEVCERVFLGANGDMINRYPFYSIFQIKALINRLSTLTT